MYIPEVVNVSMLCRYCRMSSSVNELRVKEYNFYKLPINYKEGVINHIDDLFKINKMIYHYDTEYVINHLNKSGVIISLFLEYCGLKKWRAKHRKINASHAFQIRYGLLKLINEWLDYINNSYELLNRQPCGD